MISEPLLLVLAQALLALVLMWSCFCRLVRTSMRTLREIRWAIFLLWLAAGMVLAAPGLPLLDSVFSWRPGTTPAWIWLLLLASIVIVQLATSKYWRGGTPRDFQHGDRS